MTNNLDNKVEMGLIFFNLNCFKAFDQVNHQLLTNKLDNFGQENKKPLGWKNSFLRKRKQIVVMDEPGK